MNIGIKKEIEKKYIEAVQWYENEIMTNKFVSIDVFINLSFLYWEFATEQIEFNIPNHITDAWSEVGGDRFLNVIELGLERFPNNTELIFWKKYFMYRLFCEDFTEQECLDLVNLQVENKSYIPYFYLYTINNIKYEKERDKLLQLCEISPTAKYLYIKSFIITR